MPSRLRLPRARVLAAATVVVFASVVSACVSPPDAPPSTTTTSTTAPPAATVYAAACAGTLVATTPGTITSAQITELSGIGASRKNNGVLWVHNDSGDSARVFAIGTDGSLKGEYTLTGASASDWEDIAVGPGPVAGESYLYVGDIGDNGLSRASVRVYRVPEPVVTTAATQTLTGVEALTLTYSDAPHNAEALLIDPESGELFIITKSFDGIAQVFRAPANLTGGSTTVLTLVATVSLGSAELVTAADVTPAGDAVALRTYTSVFVFPRPTGTALVDAFAETACEGAIASESQGEAIAFTTDGLAYITASEGSNPALHSFATP